MKRRKGIIPEFRADLPRISFRAQTVKLALLPREIDKTLEKPVSLGKLSFLNRRKIIFASIVAIILILIFQSAIIKAALAGALFAICACSTIWKRKYPEIPIGIELIIFGTTVASLAFGPAFGIPFGIALAISAEIISSVIGEGIFFSIIGISLVAFSANYLRGIDFILLGILMTLLFDAITQALPLLSSDAEGRAKAIIFITTHLLFNFTAFKLLAPLVAIFI